MCEFLFGFGGMFLEESELENGLVRLVLGRVYWCLLSFFMDLDGKFFIFFLMSLYEVLVDSLEGLCRV